MFNFLIFKQIPKIHKEIEAQKPLGEVTAYCVVVYNRFVYMGDNRGFLAK